MLKTWLKTLRILIPGSMILLLIVLLPDDSFKTLKSVTSGKLEPWTFPFIFAIVLGGFYYVLGIRGWFIKDSLAEIHVNIKDKLLEPFRGDQLIANKMDKLKKDRTMLHIFYSIIDTNPSLQEKAKNVYLNGLFWTTIVDLVALSLFGGIFYFIIFMSNFTYYYLFISLGLITIHFLAKFILLPKITKKHQQLGDEQIEFIHVNLKGKLEEKIKNTIK